MKYFANAPFYFALAFLGLTPKQFFIVFFLMFGVDLVSHFTARME